jgi:hypothetical protein
VTFHFQNVTRLQALFPQVFHAFGDVFFKKVKPIGIFIKEVNFSLMGVKRKLSLRSEVKRTNVLNIEDEP